MSGYEFWDELGKIFNAVVAYQKKNIEFNKRFISPWIRLGNVFEKQDRNKEAVHAYERAIELDSENPQNWFELGNIHFKMENHPEAISAFNRAIELNPGFGRAYSNLARTKAAEGKYDEAVPLYEKGISLLETNKEKADAWNGLGNAYRKLNESAPIFNKTCKFFCWLYAKSSLASGSGNWSCKIFRMKRGFFSACHFTPGTSKRKKVEHRMFSFRSSNWRGEPLRDYETIAILIDYTTTANGPMVTRRLDRRQYPTGITLPNPLYTNRDNTFVCRHGLSIWPTESIRFLAGFLGVYFFALLLQHIKRNNKEMAGVLSDPKGNMQLCFGLEGL